MVGQYAISNVMYTYYRLKWNCADKRVSRGKKVLYHTMVYSVDIYIQLQQQHRYIQGPFENKAGKMMTICVCWQKELYTFQEPNPDLPSSSPIIYPLL